MPGYADMAVCAFCGSTLRRERAPGGPRARALAAVPAPAAEPAGGEAAPISPGGFPPLVSAPAAAPTAAPFPEASSGAEEEVLHSVQCSQCAGPLSVREGRRILVCRRCGVRVMVKEHGGVSRWYFPTRLNRLKAAGASAAWLSEYPGIARDARDAQLGDARLTYAPIWEHRLLLAGWEFGRKLRTVTEFVPDANNE